MRQERSIKMQQIMQFFKADLTVFFRSQRRKSIFFAAQRAIRALKNNNIIQIKPIVAPFELFSSEMAHLVH